MVGRTFKADVAQSTFLNRQFAIVVDETDLLIFASTLSRLVARKTRLFFDGTVDKNEKSTLE